MGQLGGVFALGFLRAGHTVCPVLRSCPLEEQARYVADPRFVLVAVAEADLDLVLASLPAAWRLKVGLLQNELLPSDWRRHGIEEPTVAVVWFEKKKGRDVRVIWPSPLFGAEAPLLAEALGKLEIPVRILDSEAALVEALVLKNLYVLTSNIAGLVAGGTVGELWSAHQSLVLDVAREVLAVQEARLGEPLAQEKLLRQLGEAFLADPSHQALGRTAPARLARTLGHARTLGIPVPRLEAIAASTPLARA